VNKNKKLLKQYIVPFVIAASIVVLFVISFIFYYQHSIIREPIFIDKNATNVIYQIDELKDEGNSILLSGFVLRLDENSNISKGIRIILIDTEDGSKHYYNNVTRKPRADVNNYFENGYDFTESGFDLKINTKNLDLENRDYEIIIQPDIRKPYAIMTQVFIQDGKIAYTCLSDENPLLQEATEDILKIANTGILKVNRPDIGIFIYQIDRQLYWIANKEYFTDGWDFMCYIIDTSQPERLAEERRVYAFDNLGFNFADAEISDLYNFGNYRVAVKDIPVNYSVTKISTGFYGESDWVWNERFFPDYSFIKE